MSVSERNPNEPVEHCKDELGEISADLIFL